MRGDKPALRDLISAEEPDNIDLYCHEIIEEEAIEQQPEVEFQPSPAYEIVSFVGGCGDCNSDICFIVKATREAVRSLQELLLQDLQFVCYQCATTRINNNHG